MMLSMENIKTNKMKSDVFLRLDSISKSYHTKVLDRCSLTVCYGDYIAILGKSGSGKSTLLNIMSLIEEFDEGEITIEGSVLNKKEYSSFQRNQIGFIYQNFNLINSLTVLENIMILQNFYDMDLDSVHIDQMIQDLGIKDLLGQNCNTLSGGEKQRVAIARALAHQPSLIIADEPSGNLDDDNAQLVFSILRDFNKNKGTTIILVTHDKTRIQDANRVYELQQGKLNAYEK